MEGREARLEEWEASARPCGADVCVRYVPVYQRRAAFRPCSSRLQNFGCGCEHAEPDRVQGRETIKRGARRGRRDFPKKNSANSASSAFSSALCPPPARRPPPDNMRPVDERQFFNEKPE